MQSAQLLPLLVVLPIVGAIAIMLANARYAKYIGVATSLLVFVASLVVAFKHPEWNTGKFYPPDDAGTFTLGVSLTLAVDGVSLLLILMTTFLTPLALWASFTSVTTREREFYGWFLALLSSMLLAFMARDAITFFIGYEFTIVPMLFLIAVYGGNERRVAAIRFFVYTFVSGAISLAGILYVAALRASEYGEWTFSISLLQSFASTKLGGQQALLVFIALMVGPCVKTPFFPVHTWLPLAHDQAPTAGSVILAATLLKLGTYMIFRIVLPMTPIGAVQGMMFFSTLAIIAIVVISLVCLVQKDIKRLIAYSSVSHMGVAMLGMLAVNALGVTGSVMYMLSHGLSTGALFLCVGMMYERYHTKAFDELSGLAKRMPIWAFFVVFFTLASVGLPGLNGFVSELLCLFGVFTASVNAGTSMGWPGMLGPRWMIIAGFGSTILGAVYMLYMVGRVVWGPLKEPHAHHDHGAHAAPSDLNGREILILAPIAVVCLVIGIAPWPLMKAIEPTVQDTLAKYPAAVSEYLAQEAEAARSGKAVATVSLAAPTSVGTPTAPASVAKP
ncbi:MAG: NADH-quinone oxidoreductase subunit M [Phycisphaerales bacterium]